MTLMWLWGKSGSLVTPPPADPPALLRLGSAAPHSETAFLHIV
jgi:hypothetical protein